MKNGDKPANVITKYLDEVPIGIAHTGLTKREVFAIAAMQGLLSNANTAHQISQEYGKISTAKAYTIVCVTAKELADELLKQLEHE